MDASRECACARRKPHRDGSGLAADRSDADDAHAGAVPTSNAKTPPSNGGIQRTIGIAVGAAGIVGLGLGGYFTLRAAAKHSDAKKDCNAAETECGPRGLSDYSSAKSAASAATIGVIAAARPSSSAAWSFFLTAPKGDAAPKGRSSTPPAGGRFEPRGHRVGGRRALPRRVREDPRARRAEGLSAG